VIILEHGKGVRHSKIGKIRLKTQATKNKKCCTPYEKRGSLVNLIDEEKLPDTPIKVLKGVHEGALVTSPNKSPKKI